MGNSLWYKGDRGIWVIGIEPANPPFNISGVSTNDFTLVFVVNGVEVPGTGVFSNLTAASGSNPATITYTPSAADVGTVRTHERRLVYKRGHVTDQQTFYLDVQTIEQ